MEKLTEQQQQILSEPRVATVATLSPQGFPHLTSVWFVFENGRFLLSIPANSAKGRNIQRNPNISILIDTRDTYAQSGISVQGKAQMVTDQEAAEIRQKVHTKYIKPDALADAEIGGFFATIDDAAIILEPSKWIFWDMAALDQQVFGGKLQSKQAFYDVLP